MQKTRLLSHSVTAERAVQLDAPLVFINHCRSDLLLVTPVPTIKTLEKETARSAKNHPRFKKNWIPFSYTILLSNPHSVRRSSCIDSCLIWINSSNSTGDWNLAVLGWITAAPLIYWQKLTAPWERKVFVARSAEKGSLKQEEHASPKALFQSVSREQEWKRSYCCIWHVIYYSSLSFVKLDFDSRKNSDSLLFPSSSPVPFYCYEKA